VGVTVALVNEDQQASAPQAPAQTNNLRVSEEIERMLADRLDAMNAGDSTRAASHYAPNGILAEQDVDPPVISAGRSEIDARLLDLYNMGMRIAEVGDPILVGNLVAQPTVIWAAGDRPTPGPTPGRPTTEYGSTDKEIALMLVFRISDETGKITHQWVLSTGR
jgi:hypothetical protein